MSHDSHSHNSAGYEKKDVNVPMVLWISAATAVLILVSVIFVNQYVTMQSENATYELRLKPENPQLIELRTRKEQELTSAKLLDSTKGVYRIPIDRAIELTVEQYKADQSTPVSQGGTTR